MSAGLAKPRKRVAVLISGRGSNMSALIAAAKAPDYPAAVTFVLSNRADAAGLAIAAAEGVEIASIEHAAFPTRGCFERALQEALEAHAIDLVCLAGFMRILSADFVARWEGRMLNIHPSLLPEFKGLRTHERALEAGARRHGCTVHLVTAGMDEGPIVAQASLMVGADDTPRTLAARVLGLEHALYPLALRWLAEGSAVAAATRD